jgi:site-specific recombinase XerD
LDDTKELRMKEKQYIKYLESKNLAATTQKCYIHNTVLFLDWTGKEEIQITNNDVLNYLEYLKNQKNNQNQTRAVVLIAIRYYFTFLLENGQIPTNPTAFIKIRGTQVKKLYHIYTSEELDCLCDNYYNVYIRNFEPSKYLSKLADENIKLKRERNYTILSILIYQAVHTNELKNIKLSDIDLQKATIKITSNRKARERTLPLKAVQIGTFINYIQNVRVELIANNMQLLFDFENKNPNDIIKHLTHQLRSIDKDFRNFRQIRTSVITNWLKAENLRKVQYMAGHRSIHSTENYLPNNLENLIEDIAKHHPFL